MDIINLDTITIGNWTFEPETLSIIYHRCDFCIDLQYNRAMADWFDQLSYWLCGNDFADLILCLCAVRGEFPNLPIFMTPANGIDRAAQDSASPVIFQ